MKSAEEILNEHKLHVSSHPSTQQALAAMNEFAAQANEELIQEKQTAIDCLKKLIQFYQSEVDSEGVPTASIYDLTEVWKEASRIIQSHNLTT